MVELGLQERMPRPPRIRADSDDDDDLSNNRLETMLWLEKTFSLLYVAVLNKGQVLTDYYRLMNRHGGYVWLQSCATIICNAKNVDEQNIIAINYVLR